jgi:hypothetical protein
VTDTRELPGGVYEIVLSTTQTIGTSGGITKAEEELRQSMAAFLDLEGVSAVLVMDEIQRFGDITHGIIRTDAGGGTNPILGSAVVRHACCCVFSAISRNSPSLLFHYLSDPLLRP